MQKIALLTTLIVIIIYSTIFLIMGSIPSLEEIILIQKESWNLKIIISLPIKISRAWDLLFIFIYLQIIVFLYKKEKDPSDDICMGFLSGLTLSLIACLEFGMSLIIIFSLLIGIFAKSKFNLGFALGNILIIGAIKSFPLGFIIAILNGYKYIFNKKKEAS